MKPNALVFDLDGVLLDSETAWQKAIQGTVSALGGSWSEQDRAKMNRHLTPQEWSSYIKRTASLKENPKTIKKLVLLELQKIYKSDLPLMPGARETILTLSRHYPLALATGSDREIVEVFLQESALGDAFAYTLAAEDVKKPKPHPEIYQKALRSLKIKEKDALAIEDSDTGILASLSAGIATICLLDERYPPKKETLLRVSSVIREIPALLDLLLSKNKQTDTLEITVTQKIK